MAMELPPSNVIARRVLCAAAIFEMLRGLSVILNEVKNLAQFINSSIEKSFEIVG